MDTHECPADGCRRRLGFGVLMCGCHWRMVPRDLQREVYRTWARGRMPDPVAYMAARQAAVFAVNGTAQAVRP